MLKQKEHPSPQCQSKVPSLGGTGRQKLFPLTSRRVFSLEPDRLPAAAAQRLGTVRDRVSAWRGQTKAGS